MRSARPLVPPYALENVRKPQIDLTVVKAASLDQAVRIQAKVESGPGDPIVDPWALRDEAGSPVERRRIRSEQKLDAAAVGVLEEWAAQKKGVA